MFLSTRLMWLHNDLKEAVELRLISASDPLHAAICAAAVMKKILIIPAAE